jgi:hypothetical protein
MVAFEAHGMRLQADDLAPEATEFRFGGYGNVAGAEDIEAQFLIRLLSRADKLSQAVDFGLEGQGLIIG